MDDEGLAMDRLFMQQALQQAKLAQEKDEVPVGAVITFAHKVIAKAFNHVETLKDPTAHAEMIAVTQATSALVNKWLYNCTMYVTIEPCSMCAGALVLARIKRLVFGAKDPKAGACGSVLNVIETNKLNHRIAVQHGLLGKECGEMLKHFFQEKRRADD